LIHILVVSPGIFIEVYIRCSESRSMY